jgi:hypothetical protein
VKKIREIYKRNIYGVIGTLVFHILLLSAFLLAEVDIKGNVQEEELLIEFPEELLNEPELPEEEVQQEEETTPNDPASAYSEPESRRTNMASKQIMESEGFFDEEYTKEVEAARQLSQNVSKQLSKETVDLNDIEMPVETTEGMDPDSVKNVIYAGESNIVYYLENRYHLRLPVPVYLAQGGGKVIVDIAVNREGKVVEAEPRKNSSVRDEQIFLYAKAAAFRTVFNADSQAPEIQKGTIHYTFISQ